jgi:rod shape-determining protein MreC
VIDAGGLMGQVIATTGSNATVLLLTDPDHAVPVTVARNGVRLIVYGRGDTLELRDIPLSAGVEVGDEIVTSGLGGRFPAGFPVGKITALRPDDTHAFLVGELKPAAQLDRGRDVLLLRPGAAIRVPAAHELPQPDPSATNQAAGGASPLNPAPSARPLEQQGGSAPADAAVVPGSARQPQPVVPGSARQPQPVVPGSARQSEPVENRE